MCMIEGVGAITRGGRSKRHSGRRGQAGASLAARPARERRRGIRPTSDTGGAQHLDDGPRPEAVVLLAEGRLLYGYPILSGGCRGPRLRDST